ncbi:MAG: hypothetical protein OXC91_02800, partial [Rhodobacteraceae bacterium]|nr:hypothetical protein [Paracoccaceae bacterium]
MIFNRHKEAGLALAIDKDFWNAEEVEALRLRLQNCTVEQLQTIHMMSKRAFSKGYQEALKMSQTAANNG